MAEVILRARLAERAPEVVVGSAGLLFEGREAEPQARRVLAKRGLDLDEHRSRTISAELLAPTSLIIGMERDHVRKVALLDPSFFARSFTLPELVRAASIVGAREPEVSLRDWAERMGSMRDPGDYAYADPASEIADPFGRSGRAFRASADLIANEIDALVELAWPATTTPPSGGAAAPATTGGSHADRDRR